MNRVKRTLVGIGLGVASLPFLFAFVLLLMFAGVVQVGEPPGGLARRGGAADYRYYAYGWEDETILLRFEADEELIAQIAREFDLSQTTIESQNGRGLRYVLKEWSVSRELLARGRFEGYRIRVKGRRRRLKARPVGAAAQLNTHRAATFSIGKM